MLNSCLLSLLFLSFVLADEKTTFSERNIPKTIAIPASFLPLALEELMADTLVPITILEQKSKKVFEKYGLDFQG